MTDAERVKELEKEIARLKMALRKRDANVVDSQFYHQTHRTICWYCSNVWLTGNKPKHDDGCLILKYPIERRDKA
jgi:hypothetical protein